MTIDPDSDPYQSGVVPPELIPLERRLARFLSAPGNHESWCRQWSHVECCGQEDCDCNLAPLFGLLEQ